MSCSIIGIKNLVRIGKLLCNANKGKKWSDVDDELVWSIIASKFNMQAMDDRYDKRYVDEYKTLIEDVVHCYHFPNENIESYMMDDETLLRSYRYQLFDARYGELSNQWEKDLYEKVMEWLELLK